MCSNRFFSFTTNINNVVIIAGLFWRVGLLYGTEAADSTIAISQLEELKQDEDAPQQQQRTAG